MTAVRYRCCRYRYLPDRSPVSVPSPASQLWLLKLPTVSVYCSRFVTPMQFASGMLRAMSPVAGVIIAVAGAAGVSPMAIVRRTWIPMIAGMITVLIANVVFLG